jgi:8-oxo-dGTP pyrophosphatase MutT (NUDIX family)
MAATPLRDAATVVVVRDAACGGLEVLLLLRAERSDHNSGAWVFPGGLVDPGDREPTGLAPGMTDTQASARLKLERGGLAFYLAAIRECFEESGILFATGGEGGFAALEGERGAPIAALRHELEQGRCTLAEICQRFSLRMAPEHLHYIGHWVTPLGRAKRFDTRFFLAVAPPGQTALHDAGETLDHVWVAPQEALSASNARKLMTPTRATLEDIRPFADTQALVKWAGALEVERVQGRLALGTGGVQSIGADHPAFHEVGKLDPEGRVDVWCELRPGHSVRIGEHVVRITDANGRHTYRVGSDAEGWEEVEPSAAARLVTQDRIVIARDLSCLTPALIEAADWLAGAEGFLRPLRTAG